MVPQKTVSFKCRPVHVHKYINYENTKGKFPLEHHVIWTYKLKKFIVAYYRAFSYDLASAMLVYRNNASKPKSRFV